MSARLTALAGLAMVATPALAAPYPTIVGDWRLVGKACAAHEGAVGIRPLGLVFDEYACSFASVSRDGPVVRWRGTCGPADGEATASTVVARQDGGTLRLSIDGDDNGTYVRCGR